MKPKYLIEYALVRLLVFVLRSLPERNAFALGERLGWVLSLLLPRRRVLIKSNLQRAFPEKSEKDIEDIERLTWRNLGRNAAEFVCIPKFTEKNIQKYVEWVGAEKVETSLKEGAGLVLVAGHFTNWEVIGWATQFRFGSLLSIARPMKNPLVEKWVQARRTEGGNRIALHRDAVRATLKWLKLGNIVGILFDQNLYTGGVFVDFFSRPAATTTLPLLLHSRTESPIFFTYTLRKDDKFVVHYEGPLQLKKTGDNAKDILAGTQMLNDHLEMLVKKYPENWFWIHNRWKRQP